MQKKYTFQTFDVLLGMKSTTYFKIILYGRFLFFKSYAYKIFLFDLGIEIDVCGIRQWITQLNRHDVKLYINHSTFS